jgi:hypothetical protein
MTGFWDIAPCRIVVHRRFRSVYCLHELSPDDGGNTNLWNVGILLRDYVASYSRKLFSSYSTLLRTWNVTKINNAWYPYSIIRHSVMTVRTHTTAIWTVVDANIMGCNTAWTCRYRSAFCRSMLLPFWGLTPCKCRQYVLPKHWYLHTVPYGVTSQKISIDIFTSVWTGTPQFITNYCCYGSLKAREVQHSPCEARPYVIVSTGQLQFISLR